MNQIVRPDLLPKRQPDEQPFYGWRYLKRTQPDGIEKYEEVPLRKEDLLYPEEGDTVVQKPPHMRNLEYCHINLMAWYRDDPSVVVLGDCRIDFGAAGVQPLGPDIVALFGCALVAPAGDVSGGSGGGAARSRHRDHVA